VREKGSKTECDSVKKQKNNPIIGQRPEFRYALCAERGYGHVRRGRLGTKKKKKKKSQCAAAGQKWKRQNSGALSIAGAGEGRTNWKRRAFKLLGGKGRLQFNENSVLVPHLGKIASKNDSWRDEGRHEN